MREILLLAAIVLFGLMKSQQNLASNQTEPPELTEKNHLQIEPYFVYEKYNDLEIISHPSVQWKYGISDTFEVHLLTEFNSETSGTETISGISPVTFGLKVKLIKGKKHLPYISLLANLQTAKFGSKKFQTSHLAPSFKFLFQNDFSEKLQLVYNFGAEWDGENHNATGTYGFTLGYAFNSKFATYAEIYGFFNEFEKPDHRFGTGLSYAISDHIQVDTFGAIGLSESSFSHFLTVGFSYLIPL